MMMDQEKDKDDVFSPFRGILRAPADPWLEEKVMLRVKRAGETMEISLGTRRVLSWSLALIVVLNISVVSLSLRSNTSGKTENALSQEFDAQQSIYSY